jgi:glycosyltransferase involved in cell wall biosynthesis
MNQKSRSNLILINAIKLHQGPQRLPTGNFQHVLHLVESLVQRCEIGLKILTDLDSYPPLAERVGEKYLIQTNLKGNSLIAADRAVVSAIRRYRPKVYHRPTGQLPFSRLPCRAITGIADLSFMVLPHPWHKRLYKELSYRWSIMRADRIVCVSKFTRDDVHHRLKVPLSKLRVVYHGTNPLGAPNYTLSKNINGKYFLVFAHQVHKNAELCLEVLEKLRDRHPDLNLVLVGSNLFIEGYLKPLAKRLNLSEAAKFVGAPTAAELSGLYRRARGLLFPSRFEGFGLPVLEAMGVDCPVLSSNVCSLPEIAGDGAVLLAPNDIEGWIRETERFLVDDEHYRRMVQLGRLQAAQFTWDKAADATISIYRELFG